MTVQSSAPELCRQLQLMKTPAETRNVTERERSSLESSFCGHFECSPRRRQFILIIHNFKRSVPSNEGVREEDTFLN